LIFFKEKQLEESKRELIEVRVYIKRVDDFDNLVEKNASDNLVEKLDLFTRLGLKSTARTCKSKRNPQTQTNKK
jgi:hypothetical protein